MTKAQHSKAREDTQSGVMGFPHRIPSSFWRSTRGLPKPSPKISRAGLELSLSQMSLYHRSRSVAAPMRTRSFPKQKRSGACSSRSQIYRPHRPCSCMPRAESPRQGQQGARCPGKNRGKLDYLRVSLRKKRITRPTRVRHTSIGPGRIARRQSCAAERGNNTQRGQRTTGLAIYAQNIAPVRRYRALSSYWAEHSNRMKHSGFRRPGQQLFGQGKVEL